MFPWKLTVFQMNKTQFCEQRAKVTCQVPTKVSFGPHLETSVDDGSFCTLIQHLSRLCSSLCWRIKALESCWEGEYQSHVCHCGLERGPEVHVYNCKALPQQWLCHHRGWCADIIRFQSFCNAMQIKAQMASGESLSGKLIPLDLSGFQWERENYF